MSKKEYLLLFLGITAIAVTGVFIYKSVKGLANNITKEQKEELDIKIVRTDK